VLEVVEKVEDRARGLMGRAEVPRGTGMLFRFERPGRHSFWMYGCLVPLDIIWIDEHGVVVHVGADLPPCKAEPCPSYAPDAPANSVIELAAGEAARLGIKPGALVLVTERGG